MNNLAIDYVNLTRICEFARRLHQLHRVGDDEAIDSPMPLTPVPCHLPIPEASFSAFI
jgi:hypothetical protein